MTILVACLGNQLRGDDAVGVEVARLLQSSPLPPEVNVEEFGIAGVHLIQALLAERPSGLIVVDCSDRGRPPGTVMVVEPEVTDPGELPVAERHEWLADMHYTNPEKALAVARGMGLLPGRVLLVGIQPADVEGLDTAMSPQVARAVPVAVDEVRALLAGWLEE